MAKRLLNDKLIHKEEITEELKLVEESNVDYVTPTGKIYCDYGNGMMLPKSVFLNQHNGYLYTSIHSKSGKQIQRRVHILVAKAFVPNPNNFTVVMHKDNNKANPKADNLEWGTTQQNTLDAFKDGLEMNDKGFGDSQSFPVVQLNLNKEVIQIFGSISIASAETKITKTGISYQCKHKIKDTTKTPKCGFYFRYLEEFDKFGFVL